MEPSYTHLLVHFRYLSVRLRGRRGMKRRPSWSRKSVGWRGLFSADRTRHSARSPPQHNLCSSYAASCRATAGQTASRPRLGPSASLASIIQPRIADLQFLKVAQREMSFSIWTATEYVIMIGAQYRIWQHTRIEIEELRNGFLLFQDNLEKMFLCYFVSSDCALFRIQFASNG